VWPIRRQSRAERPSGPLPVPRAIDRFHALKRDPACDLARLLNTYIVQSCTRAKSVSVCSARSYSVILPANIARGVGRDSEIGIPHFSCMYVLRIVLWTSLRPLLMQKMEQLAITSVIDWERRPYRWGWKIQLRLEYVNESCSCHWHACC
jgi:hypothetical protein